MDTMERIMAEYDAMSKSQQKIVHFMQLNEHDMLTDSLAVLSHKIGCSEATVVRFARQLGYSGYTDMQRALYNELLAKVNPSPQPPAGADGGNFFLPLANSAAQRIRTMYEELDMAEFDAFCRALMQAQSVLLVGYMDSFGVASHALHLLDDIRSNVNFARLLLETNEVYRHIHKEAAVLIVSFAPHYKYTKVLFDLAVQQGSTTLLITDSMLNPLARAASHVICAKPYFDAEARIMDVTAPTHLVYAMARKIATDYPDKVEAYRKSSMRRFEEYID